MDGEGNAVFELERGLTPLPVPEVGPAQGFITSEAEGGRLAIKKSGRHFKLTLEKERETLLFSAPSPQRKCEPSLACLGDYGVSQSLIYDGAERAKICHADSGAGEPALKHERPSSLAI